MWVMASPLGMASESPKVHSPGPVRPDVASVALPWKVRSSPTLTVVAAVLIAATGGVRSTTTLSQLAVERLALSAVAVWFGPFGLSGIEASAAITQAHTSPSTMLP